MGLIEKAGERLSAIALCLVVGTEIESVDVGIANFERIAESRVDVEHVCGSVKAETDAALVGDNENAQSGLIEFGDGFGNSGENVEFVWGGDVAAFRHLAIEHSIAVQKYGVNRTWNVAVCRV